MNDALRFRAPCLAVLLLASPAGRLAAQAAFRKLGPVAGPQGEALRRRFQSACERFFELRPHQTARSR